ncbi:MAG: hypothetical protein PVJ76_11600, partial [Gemmatimonadota bacterium]
MQTRREFLGAMSWPTAAAFAGIKAPLPTFARDGRAIASELASHPGTPDQVAADEMFWADVQRAFSVDRTLVNLNNGGV